MKRRVLVVGSGGREHAIVRALRSSPDMGDIFCAPGNGGTSTMAHNIAVKADDIEGLLRFAKSNADLTIVGPEDPLALGIVNVFQGEGLPVFGPCQEAALLEYSKAAAKIFMQGAGIPTGRYEIFSDYVKARLYLRKQLLPLVIKASGLARGKGVYVCHTEDEAREALDQIMVKRVHGSAGDQVVIEEYLSGREVSAHAFCDGASALLMPLACDYKRLHDGDTGPNTGGMGGYAPASWVSTPLVDQIRHEIVRRTIAALGRVGAPFVGCLYPGLMITAEGPKVLEFNARFGDPEAQVILRLLAADVLEIIEACISGDVQSVPVEWKEGCVVCVVLASRGYPTLSMYPCVPVEGIDDAEKIPGVVVFHAGTKYHEGMFYACGGRVLSVTAWGSSLSSAHSRAYEAANKIHFDGMQYRTDIAASV